MSSNGKKWFWMIVLGFTVGLISASMDKAPTLWDYVRHGLVGVGPTLAGLKTRLEESLGLDARAMARGAGG